MSQTEQDVVVLVADDEPSTLALVASHVRSKGFKVLEASDGDQAWQLAHEHLPDLVILDVMMPGMSGWEVCRKIREAVSLAHTGVVMLTGIGENLNEMTSPLYGADAYLDKPFEFTELDAKVTATLAERREGAMGRPDPEATERRASQPPPGANGMSSALAAPAVKRRARAAKAESDPSADSGAAPTQRLAPNRPTKRISPARADARAKKSEQASSKSKRADTTTKAIAKSKGKAVKARAKKPRVAKAKSKAAPAKPKSAAKATKSAPKTKAAKKAARPAATAKAKARKSKAAKAKGPVPKSAASKNAKRPAVKAASMAKRPAKAAPKTAEKPAAAAKKSSNGAARKASTPRAATV